MKIIIVVLLILFLKFSTSAPPSCMSYKGGEDGIDKSWYIYQLQKETGIYFWNSLQPDQIEKKLEQRYSLRFDNQSPFIRTFSQITNDKDNGFEYLTYNDQPGGKKQYLTDLDLPEGGHSKGFMIWNEEGGIHVMHSMPKFPLYTTYNMILDGNAVNPLKKGQFEWRSIEKVTSVTGHARRGLESFEHMASKNKPKDPEYQQGQYAYCFPISAEEIKNGYIYRHLVLTNPIIGILNGLEVRSSLSNLEVNRLDSSTVFPTNPDLFPRVNLAYDEKFHELFEILNPIYKLPYSAQLTEQKIMTSILGDILMFTKPANNVPFPPVKYFPLYYLAKHAYYFIVFGGKQHLPSSDSLSIDSTRLFFYQRDKYYPKLTGTAIVNGRTIKGTFEQRDDTGFVPENIWSYISTLKVTNSKNTQVSQLGNLYLQTQHYDDPDKVSNLGVALKGKGFVPEIKPNMYLLETMYLDRTFVSRHSDHSKQAFSVLFDFKGNAQDKYIYIDSDSDGEDVPIELDEDALNDMVYNWFCVGDNNFMSKQSTRGGSVHCFKNQFLAQFFSENVKSYSNLNNAGLLETFDKNEEVKQFVNTILSNRLKETKLFNQIYKFLLGKSIFPPPPSIDLWVEDQFDYSIKYNFNGVLDIFKTTIIKDAQQNDIITSRSSRDVRFCWSSNFATPNVFVCSSPKCENGRKHEQFLCTNKKFFAFHTIPNAAGHSWLFENSLFKPTQQYITSNPHTFTDIGFQLFQRIVLSNWLAQELLKDYMYFLNENDDQIIYILKLPFIEPPTDSRSSVINYCGKYVKLTTKPSSFFVFNLYGPCMDLFYYCFHFTNNIQFEDFKIILGKLIGEDVSVPDYQLPNEFKGYDCKNWDIASRWSNLDYEPANFDIGNIQFPIDLNIITID